MNDSTAYTYWVIQYQDSPFRREPRNIGVVVQDSATAVCRLLGKSDAGVDIRPFCALAGLADSVGWVYREWSHWFDSLVEAARGGLTLLPRELECLANRQGRFTVAESATIFASEPVGAEAMAASLFEELVSAPQVFVAPLAEFEQRIQDIFDEGQLSCHPQFHRDVELGLELADKTVFIRFDAFLEGPKALGIKLLRLGRARDGQAGRQVNDIAHTFDMAVKHGILARDGCIVIHDRVSPTRKIYLDRIAANAVLLLASSADVVATLRRMAHR